MAIFFFIEWDLNPWLCMMRRVFYHCPTDAVVGTLKLILINFMLHQRLLRILSANFGYCIVCSFWESSKLSLFDYNNYKSTGIYLTISFLYILIGDYKISSFQVSDVCRFFNNNIFDKSVHVFQCSGKKSMFITKKLNKLKLLWELLNLIFISFQIRSFIFFPFLKFLSKDHFFLS